MSVSSAAALRAEPELRGKLERLDTAQDPGLAQLGTPTGTAPETPPETSAEPTAGTQERADALLARIAWSRLSEPGDRVTGRLLAALGPEAALALLVAGAAPRKIAAEAVAAGAELDAESVSQAVDRWRPRLDRAATVRDIDRAVETGMRIAVPGDAVWPTEAFGALGEHMPVMLWLRGAPALLVAPSLSVVGARAATGYGMHTTAEIVDGVCRAGLTVVSGAAYGVDATAHRTALATRGTTIAVLAGGADRHYPAAHDTLIERIAREGLVCAEMVPGSAPTKWRFRMRNRLIAALSPATLVTEAGVRSGTLNTAGHAAELGRALGAVPGPVTSAASAGCHKLIREYGAALVTNAREACELLGYDDRLDVFGGSGGSGTGGTGGSRRAGESGRGQDRPPPEQERVLDALPLRGRRSLEEIARRAGMDTVETRGALAELELLGRVQRRETPGDPKVKWALLRTQ